MDKEGRLCCAPITHPCRYLCLVFLLCNDPLLLCSVLKVMREKVPQIRRPLHDVDSACRDADRVAQPYCTVVVYTTLSCLQQIDIRRGLRLGAPDGEIGHSQWHVLILINWAAIGVVHAMQRMRKEMNVELRAGLCQMTGCKYRGPLPSILHCRKSTPLSFTKDETLCDLMYLADVAFLFLVWDVIWRWTA